MQNKQAFTLIELLVVVLIIGILAAVALPQYQKAVEKAKAAQVLPLLKATANVAESYFLANGTYPTQLNDLDVTFPAEWNKKTTAFLSNGVLDSQANDEWSLELYKISEFSVTLTRLTGPYKGAAFVFPLHATTTSLLKPYQLYCKEIINRGIIFTNSPGSYCKNIWGGTLIGGADVRIYELP